MPASATERSPEEASRAPRAGLALPQLWAFLTVALPIVGALRATIATNDLAYQIRAGDIMLRTHHIIRTDLFTFTALGKPWLDQQWGSQIVFALLYRAGGWAALALLRAFLVGAIYLFVYLACRQAGTGVRTSAWLSLASFGVSLGGLALRPQLMGLLLFAATVWVVFGRPRHPMRMWAVPVIVALWANVHGSFFLGPLLVALAWLEDVRDRRPGSRSTLGVGIASVAAATLNPFALRVWSYAFGLSTNPAITRFISEWAPTTVRDGAGAVFYLSLVAVIAFLLLRRPRAPWPLLVTLGVFAFIGLEAIRGIFWWGLIAPVVVAKLLTRASTSAVEERPSLLNTAIAAALVALGVAFLPWWHGGSRSAPSPNVVSNAPLRITAELRTVLRPGDHFFDPVTWASWFELALPQNPVFMDPRIEIFPSSVLRQHLEVSLAQEGWQGVLDRWRIRVVVADRGEEGQLIPNIRRDPGWRLVYEDASGLIFERSTS